MLIALCFGSLLLFAGQISTQTEVGFLLPAPDRLRIGAITGAGLRVTDLEGGAWQLTNLMGDAVHERDGGGLLANGVRLVGRKSRRTVLQDPDRGEARGYTEVMTQTAGAAHIRRVGAR